MKYTGQPSAVPSSFAQPSPDPAGSPSRISRLLRSAQYSIPIAPDPLSDFIYSWGFEPVGFGFWSQVKKPSVLKDNMLSQFMLVLMSRGQCDLNCHSGRYLLSAYDCVIIPPYLMYTAHLDSIATLQYLPDLLNAAAVQRLEQVYQNARQHEAGRFLQIQSLLYSILIPMFCRQGSESLLALPIRSKTNEEQLVLSCMELADQKIAEGLQVADLCQAFHVSQSYLYRSFSHVLHCSPRTWLRTFRIEKSLAFLQTPRYSVEQVAEKAGFSSIYHYSRVFKEVMGRSPSQYRRELKSRGKE